MSEITAAIDETAANKLLDAAIASIGSQTFTDTGTLGPFTASYKVTGTVSNGDVDLVPPATIRVTDLRVDWHLDLSFGFDLSSILPDFCLPQVCVDIPCVGRVCSPLICIDWPSVTIPVSFGDFTRATVDLGISVTLQGGVWRVEAVIQGVPNLQFGATTAALLAAIGLAATPVLLAVPFVGPILAVVVNALLAAIGLAGITGFLGPIISPFVAGIRVPVYGQPQQFVVLGAESAVDPQVDIVIDQITASVVHNAPEDELVIGAEISA
jgi:hypothetical protein